jgi:hypothetical protein
MAALVGSFDSLVGPSDFARTEPKKKKQKCALPDCAEMTSHNGGYCCARHCKLHREKRRQRPTS